MVLFGFSSSRIRKYASILLGCCFIFAFYTLLNESVSKPRHSNLPSPAVSTRNTTSTKINACILVLVRNEELHDLIETIRQLDAKFNHKYNYPYVLFNNQEFSEHFRANIVKHTNSLVEFGKIAAEHWDVPDWIDRHRLRKALAYYAMRPEYTKGHMLSYHQMIRFFSGFFYRHNLTLKYDYYMRIDQKLDFPCHFDADPFALLANRAKLYGFIIAAHETPITVPTLWPTVLNWLTDTERQSFLTASKAVRFLTNGSMTALRDRQCSFWTNFEVAAFSIFRSKTYANYFEYLDRRGGFFYERWGDAPVHSIFVLLTLNMDQIERFTNFGYAHDNGYQWPMNASVQCDLADEKLIASRNAGKYLWNCTKEWDDFV